MREDFKLIFKLPSLAIKVVFENGTLKNASEIKSIILHMGTGKVNEYLDEYAY